MRHTTRIELVNREDQLLAKAGVIAPGEIRQVTVEDAIVDTGATRLSLSKPLIEQLGLTPVGRDQSTHDKRYCRAIYLFGSSLYGFGAGGNPGDNGITSECAGSRRAHGFRNA